MSSLKAELPTGRRGNILAVGFTLVVIALLWISLLSPAFDWYSQRQDRLQQRQTLAARMATVAATAPALQRQAAASIGEPRLVLVEGATEAIAGAALQQRLQEMAEHAAVRMTSAEVLAAEPSGTLRRIRVHVVVTAPWLRLVRLLSDVDQATPRMVVSEIQVGQSRSITTEVVKPLDASFTVLALYAGRAP